MMNNKKIKRWRNQSTVGKCVVLDGEIFLIVIVDDDLITNTGIFEYFESMAKSKCETMALENPGQKYSYVKISPVINGICEINPVIWSKDA